MNFERFMMESLCCGLFVAMGIVAAAYYATVGIVN